MSTANPYAPPSRHARVNVVEQVFEGLTGKDGLAWLVTAQRSAGYRPPPNSSQMEPTQRSPRATKTSAVIAIARRVMRTALLRCQPLPSSRVTCRDPQSSFPRPSPSLNELVGFVHVRAIRDGTA